MESARKTVNRQLRPGYGLHLEFGIIPSKPKGYIAEIIIYNSALSDTDRVAVEDYLYGKYIPEPATIALLGLGGLVLIRKRR